MDTDNDHRPSDDDRDIDTQLATCEDALARDPTAVEAWYTKGSLLRMLDRPAEAEVALRQAIALQPTHVDAWYEFGLVCLRLQRPDEALAAFEQTILLFPSYAHAWNQRNRAWTSKGMALKALERYDEALTAFAEALAIDPADFFAWYGTYFTLQQQGNTEAAEQAYTEIQRLRQSGWSL